MGYDSKVMGDVGEDSKVMNRGRVGEDGKVMGRMCEDIKLIGRGWVRTSS